MVIMIDTFELKCCECQSSEAGHNNIRLGAMCCISFTMRFWTLLSHTLAVLFKVAACKARWCGRKQRLSNVCGVQRELSVDIFIVIWWVALSTVVNFKRNQKKENSISMCIACEYDIFFGEEIYDIHHLTCDHIKTSFNFSCCINNFLSLFHFYFFSSTFSNRVATCLWSLLSFERIRWCTLNSK